MKTQIRHQTGFTLAELLIALAILGVIATFTIPKILESSQNEKYNSVAKETMAAIAGAYKNYKLNNTVTSSTSASDIMAYVNYVNQIGTNQVVDAYETADSATCNTGHTCYQLANGSILFYNGFSYYFNGMNPTNAIAFFLDPDGKYSGGIPGPGKSVVFFLYYDGKLRTFATIEPNTVAGGSTYSATPSYDPPWLSWN